MPQLYTPFLAKAGATVGNAMLARGDRQRQDEEKQFHFQTKDTQYFSLQTDMTMDY